MDAKIFAIMGQDTSDGFNAEVRGTPTVFINWRLLRNLALEGFQTLIEKGLEKAGKGK